MGATYEIKFAKKSAPFSRNLELHSGELCNRNVKNRMFAFENFKIHTYTYDLDSFIAHNETILKKTAATEKCFVYLTENFSNIPNVAILKTPDGISFYKCNNHNFKLISQTGDYEENEFHDVYDWDKYPNKVLFGNFYADKRLVGVLTQHQEYGVAFHAIMKDALLGDSYPIWPLKNDLNSLTSVGTEYFLHDLKRRQQENIISLNGEGINVYEFNKNSQIKLLFDIRNSKLRDSYQKMFFVNLTNQPLDDIIVMNSRGLFLYQYHVEGGIYNLLEHNVMFSKARGWTEEHLRSVQFEDINGDGRKEMLFTGPRGVNILSFGQFSKEWETVLLNSEALSIQERHSPIVFVKYPNIWAVNNEGRLVLGKMTESNDSFDEQEADIETLINANTSVISSPQPPFLFLLPRIISDSDEHDHVVKYNHDTVLLRDNLDCSSIMQAVDMNAGKLKFMVPLINLSNLASGVKLNIFYDGTNEACTTLGTGWSLSQNLIVMDHRSSIFPEDESYFLIIESMLQALKFDANKSSNQTYFFTINHAESDAHDLQVTYYKPMEKWEITQKGVGKRIYGGVNKYGKTHFERTWDNWREEESNTHWSERNKSIATAWYLAEEICDESGIINYEYETNALDGHKTEIYLKSIVDDNGNAVRFNYSSKKKSEYELKYVNENNELITKITEPTRYLQYYKLFTNSYSQDIHFGYKFHKGKRYLSEIVQSNIEKGTQRFVNERPIFQFFYANASKSQVLQHIILPNGVNLNYDYKSLCGTDDFGHRYDVSDDYRINYGISDILLSYVNKEGQLSLRMFNDSMKRELYSSETLSVFGKLPLLGFGSVSSHDVFRFPAYIAIILKYAMTLELYLFNKIDQSHWSTIPKVYQFSAKGLIQFAHNDIIVADSNSSVDVIAWNEKTKAWSRRVLIKTLKMSPPLISASSRIVLIYDDDVLRIVYKSRKNDWECKIIKKGLRIITDIKYVLSKFDLDEESHATFLKLYTNNALQSYKNLFIFARWHLEHLKLYLLINFYTLNRNYEIAHEQTFKLAQDDLAHVEKEIEGANGNYVTIGYQYENNKFKKYVKSFRGPIAEDIKRTNQNQEEVNELKKNIVEGLKQLYLFDPIRYMAVLNLDTVYCKKHFINFVGNKWILNAQPKETAQKFSFPLGTSFTLNKERVNASITLVSNQKITTDLNVKLLNETSIHYPRYLAYQAEQKEINIVKFTKDGSDIEQKFNLPNEEKLTPWSNPNMLVTEIRNYAGDYNKTVIFRPQLVGNPVISKVTINFGKDGKQETGYKYDCGSAKFISDAIYYGTSTLIPGNKNTTFGWIEDVKDFNNETLSEKRVFAGDGKLIKVVKIDEEERHKDEKDDEKFANSILTDATGRHTVAQFYPFEIAHEEVSYYGFEDYEVNRIGAKSNGSSIAKKWIFDEADVIRGQFSLTGRNMLNLTTKSLEGTFIPRNQNRTYVASCWMETLPEIFKIGEVVPHLKVVVRDTNKTNEITLLSEVKYKLGNWFYLEVIVDLFDVLLEMSNADSKNVRFQTTVIIAPDTNTSIHLDHVRFSPLVCDFKANIYHHEHKQITSVINFNGLIQQYVYHKQKQIAIVNEQGQLDKLITNSKSSGIGSINGQMVSVTQIRPNEGFYENFAPDSFKSRFKIDNAENWAISPHKLYHVKGINNIHLLANNISQTSYGIRLCYNLIDTGSSITLHEKLALIQMNNKSFLVFLSESKPIPNDGELIVIVENNRLLVWIDGGLYVDEICSMAIDLFRVQEEVVIKDLMIFNEMSVSTTYFNELNDKVQEISLENNKTAIITEYIYDELGRNVITTSPIKVTVNDLTPLMIYNEQFVTNKNPFSLNSVWNIGKLQGLISELSHNFDYSETKYQNNPLKQITVKGLPGKEFSTSGKFARRFSTLCGNHMLSNLFMDKSCRCEVEYKAENSKYISVFDKKNNRVAWYASVPGSTNLLSTFEYDDENRLIKQLPPLYHEKVGTLFKLDNFKSSKQEEMLQNILGTHNTYDKNGNLLTKTTPDTGRLENIYDHNGFLKYTLNYSRANATTIENIIYYTYDVFGRLSETRSLKTIVPRKDLLSLTQSQFNGTDVYQEFHYSESDREPIFRNRLKRVITYNNHEPYVEEFLINSKEETLSKRVIIPIENNDDPLTIAVDKKFGGDGLKEINYPAFVQGVPFVLTYRYNKIGNVIGIGIPGESDLFAKLEYDGRGHVALEHHTPRSTSNFTRHYTYNSPGFLTSITDKFLTEEVSYTEDGYGHSAGGDGMVTRTEFTATWHKYSNNRTLGLNERSFVSDDVTLDESKLCFTQLAKNGYLDEFKRQRKIYYPDLDVNLPIVCRYGLNRRRLASILGRKGFPVKYGHAYDYGGQRELTKAKYFVGSSSEALKPFQPNTFTNEIPDLNVTASVDIWTKLTSAGYLIEHNDKNDFLVGHAKKGKTFIRTTLLKDLSDLGYRAYESPIENLLLSCRNLTLSTFERLFIKWHGSVKTKKLVFDANKIFNMLRRKSYTTQPASQEFNHLLRGYELYLPKIVEVITKYTASQLGEAEFDVESYEIDSNGNHRHFYTGFDRYFLTYRDNSNQVEKVARKAFTSTRPEVSHAMKHDSKGNVIEALHKGIRKIAYDKVSNRAMSVELVDGKKLGFHYDSKGERIHKIVKDKDGEILREVHYVRDDIGRSLVEKEISYLGAGLEPDVLTTIYIYLESRIIGFIRRDEFYSVISDHEGSTRLIVRNGEVVASYDYLPYGNLMRSYGSNPEAHISYRYTGQEWDDEISMYNFHARFYDPDIGRFFQIDPKAQYFSPYMYAGNSPVSMIDPDGEFAFLLIAAIIGAIAGTYVGGAAANNNWNPARWDWKNSNTYLGMLFGGVSGALLPVGIASFGATGLVLSAGMTYLELADAFGTWDPNKFDISSPKFLEAVMSGFSGGLSIPIGFKQARLFYKSLSKIGKVSFLLGGIAIGAGTFTASGFANNWDFTKPGIYKGFVNFVTGATDLPMLLASTPKIFKKFGRYFEALAVKHLMNTRGKQIRTILHDIMKSAEFKSMLSLTGKNFAHTASVAFFTYLMGSVDNNSFNKWDMKSASTYYALLNGLLMGAHLTSTARNEIGRKLTKMKVKKNEKISKFLKEQATDAVQTYQNNLDYFNTNIPKYSEASVHYLTSGKVPNAAVTIILTRKSLIVTYSSNQAPGMIMFYVRNKYNTPKIKYAKFLDDNQIIGDLPVRLNDNPLENSKLMNAIEDKQSAIKKVNFDTFNDKAYGEKLKSILDSEAILIGSSKENAIDNIKNRIFEKGYIEKREINQILQNSVIEPQLERIKQLDIEIKQIGDKLKVGKLSQAERKELQEIIKRTVNSKNLEIKEITGRKKQFMSTINDELSENVWKEMSTFKERLTHWDPTNCGEPHALSTWARLDKVFTFNPKIRYNPDKNPIKYMATYKLHDWPELTPFKRCDHCLVSTAHIPNVVTDPSWDYSLHLLRDKVSKYNYAVSASFERYFLRYAIAANSWLPTNSTKSAETVRNKRRSPKHASVNQPENINEHKQVANSASTSMSYWIRNCFNQLKTFFSNHLEITSSNSNARPTNLNMGDTCLSQIDLNGTILLADVFFAKKNKRNIYSLKTNDNIKHEEALTLTFSIMDAFTDIVTSAALMANISHDRLNVDDEIMLKVQESVYGKILSNRFDKIVPVLKFYAKHIYAESGKGYPHKLHFDTFNHFLTKLENNGVFEELVCNVLKDTKQGFKQNVNETIKLGNVDVLHLTNDKKSTRLCNDLLDGKN